MNVLDRYHRHLFLEKYDNTNNSFIANINNVALIIQDIIDLNRKLPDDIASKLNDLTALWENLDSLVPIGQNLEGLVSGPNSIYNNMDTLKFVSDNLADLLDVHSMYVAITDLIDNFGNAFLRTTGGTMTGTIVCDASPAIKAGPHVDALRLYGDPSGTSGARLTLRSASGEGSENGMFFLSSFKTDGTGQYMNLEGNADLGWLKWNGYNVITSAVLGNLSSLNTTDKDTIVAAINEVNTAAGKTGNLNSLTTTDKSSLVAAINELVTRLGNYVLKAGDTMSGTLTINNNTGIKAGPNTDGLRLYGDNSGNSGARLTLRNAGGGSAAENGMFYLSSYKTDGSGTYVNLEGNADNGTLRWNGKNVLCQGDTAAYPTVQAAEFYLVNPQNTVPSYVSATGVYTPAGGTWWVYGRAAYSVGSGGGDGDQSYNTVSYNQAVAGGTRIASQCGSADVHGGFICIKIA